MARTTVRFVLIGTLALVVIITYSALSKHEDVMMDPDRFGARSPLGAGHKSVGRRGEPVHRPPDAIHVAYPVENVAGLEEVAGGHSPNKSENVSAAPDDFRVPLNGSSPFVMPLIPGENVVSMTLYGRSMRYTMGAIRNAELVKRNYPGWKLRIYTEDPVRSRHGGIPSNVMESLRALGADFYFMQPGEDYIPPMMWRFLIADDTWVDRFIVRDADARLTQRDAAATYAWVTSGRPFTCIRDHPSHAGYAISGGLWGAKPRELRNILRRSWRELMGGMQSQYLEDMNFLNSVIWPKVRAHAWCADSVSCDSWPGSYPFPVPRFGYEHVGQVVNEHDLGRPGDLQILRTGGVNTNCTPAAAAGDDGSRRNKR